jgi:chemotaxis signal transduction protein
MGTIPSSLLLFRLGYRRLALELAAVAEVLEEQPTFPIPLAPPCFVGVMNSHGSLVSLVDLGRYLDDRNSATPGKVLVLDRRIGRLALRVDEVERIVAAEELDTPRAVNEPLHHVLVEISGEDVPVLAADLLVAQLEEDLLRSSRPAVTPGAATGLQRE